MLANDQEIQDFIKKYPLWSINQHKIHRHYVFSDFVQAFGFMTEVAMLAERHDHHPEWFNSYKTVTVDLSTHAVQAITDKDFKLAIQMENIAMKKIKR